MTSIKLALCATASLFCIAEEAQAANYILYDVRTDGTRTSYDAFQPGLELQNAASYIFQFALQLDGQQAANFTYTATSASYSYLGSYFLGSSGNIQSSGTILSLTERSHADPDYAFGGLVAITACLSFASGSSFPNAFGVFTDPSCGKVEYSSRGKYSGFVYRGRVLEVSAQSFTGTLPISRGLQSITTAPAPEPSTWTLMLAGFSLAGYVLRRRGADRRVPVLSR